MDCCGLVALVLLLVCFGVSVFVHLAYLYSRGLLNHLVHLYINIERVSNMVLETSHPSAFKNQIKTVHLSYFQFHSLSSFSLFLSTFSRLSQNRVFFSPLLFSRPLQRLDSSLLSLLSSANQRLDLKTNICVEVAGDEAEKVGSLEKVFGPIRY